MNMDSVKTTLGELQRWSQPQVGPRMRLRLDRVGSETTVRAVPETEFGYIERVKAFFGCSSYNLSKIVSFLQSSDFFEKLDHCPLDMKQHAAVGQAVGLLDKGIDKHNSRCWLIGTLISSHLTETLMPHCHVTLKPLVQEFEKKLVEDVRMGKVVVTKDILMHYPDFQNQFATAFSSLSDVDKKSAMQVMNRAVSSAYVQQEISRLERKVAGKSHPIEQYLLEKYCAQAKRDYPTTDAICRAQASALERYRASRPDLTLDATQKEVEDVKRRALIACCGIPVDACDKWNEILVAMNGEFDALQKHALHKQNEAIAAIEAQKLPPLAKEYLKKQVSENLKR